MAKFLISFPSEAMQVRADELLQVSEASHAVIERAKAAGVYVFGGGINESIDPVLVAADGSMIDHAYPGSTITGGFLVLECPTREEAIAWAQEVAVACRCAQELREFGYDPAS